MMNDKSDFLDEWLGNVDMNKYEEYLVWLIFSFTFLLRQPSIINLCYSVVFCVTSKLKIHEVFSKKNDNRKEIIWSTNMDSI